ncbi:MAG: nucleotidyl transferase AbiEii/AbiGii toxin family protein [Deltaproteobacteria bacterium]|nr:nucleotidyl transferase AbiEii/AbiGii toxin family protein [Deltaproteobacteria bacterium]
MPFPTRLDILPPGQRKLWPFLSPLKDMGYCLYGGTALALRYGHRQSVDFDFFSDRPLDEKGLGISLPWLTVATILRNDPGTFVVLASPPRSKRAVKVSLFGELSLGRVGIPELTSDGVVLAASVRDLMATKLKALFDRVEPRDYLDIAAMLRNKVSLPQGLADARVLFGNFFSAAECMRILCWFDDPDLASLPDHVKRTLAKEVKTAWDKPLPPSKKAGSGLAI